MEDKQSQDNLTTSILTEFYKWPVSGYLEEEHLRNLDPRLILVHDDIIFLVSSKDEFFTLGRDTFNERGISEVEPISWAPKNIPALNHKQIIDIKIGSQNSSPSTLISVFALSSTGKLYSWGNIAHTATPTEVSFPSSSSSSEEDGTDSESDSTRIISLSVGGGHVLALSSQGEVWAWGKNNMGQVGHTFKVTHRQPLKVSFGDADELHSFVSISCGETHSAAVTEGGRVYCWGANDKGQLGNRSREEFSVVPVLAYLPKAVLVKKISCGRRHTLALSTSGELFAFGSAHHGELGVEMENGNEKKHRHGSKSKSRVPVRVVLDPDAEVDRVVEDIATLNHDAVSICKTVDGAVYMWGKVTEPGGKSVDLPWKTLMNSMTDALSSFVHPAAMPSPLTWNNCPSVATLPHPKLLRNPGLKFLPPAILSKLRLAFVCGSGFEQTGIVIDSFTDQVSFLGKNVHGSFGTGSEIIWETGALSSAHEILSGQGITNFQAALDPEGGCMCFFALTLKGHIFSWGYNEYGEMATGTTSAEPTRPQRITGGGIGDVKIVALATGSDHFLALSEEGNLYSWGYNMYGQLGTGNQELESFSSVPKRLDFYISGGGEASTQICKMAAGSNHSVAVGVDATSIYVWGRNDSHQLGGAVAGPYSGVPIRLKCNLDVKEVSCGSDFTLLLSLSGNVFMFGTCKGSGLVYARPTILIVDGLSEEVTRICATHWASLAGFETRGGGIYLWGRVRGGKVLEEVTNKTGVLASSVEDAVELYSSPWGCVSSIRVDIT